MAVEEYTLSNVDCPLGTVIGPGRYGMYWVARMWRFDDEQRVIGTVFRQALSTDLEAVLIKPSPDSVVEHRLRVRRGLNSDESRKAYVNSKARAKLIFPKQGRKSH